MEKHEETKIQHLRNLLTPFVNYFKMMEKANGCNDVDQLKILNKYIKIECTNCQQHLPEILKLVKELPDDCAGLR